MKGVYYNEIDPYCAGWLRNLIAAGHIAAGDVDERSIVDVRADDLRGYGQCHFFAGIAGWSHALRLAGWPDDRLVWTGSCPCQPLSAAGQRQGHADERHVWPAFHRLIAECAPATILGEQVASKDGREWFAAVRADMEALGYACGAADLCAAGFGAPHIRQRLYWVGHRERTGLEGHARHGDGAARWSLAGGSVAETGAARELADTECWRLSGRQQRSAASQAEQSAENSESGWLADAARGCNANERVSNGSAGQHVGAFIGASCGSGHGDRAARDREAAPGDEGALGLLGHNSRARPTSGLWRDADWILCRDGKWRPIIATHVALVNGPAESLGPVRAESDAEAEEGEVNALRALFKATGSEALFERCSGEPVHAGEAQVLRPAVHGERDVEGSLSESQPQPRKSGGDGAASVRVVRDERPEAPRASQGSRPAQQRPCELEDALRLLSPSLSLAELHGDRRTTSALHALRRAIDEAGAVLHPSDTVAAVWASLGEEAKDRIRLGFNAPRWEVVDGFPLETNAPSRVGRLRAYGNAIMPQVAAEFVMSYMETGRG